MYCGKYDLTSLNDGRYELRWFDKGANKHFKHIIHNIEEMFDRMIAENMKAHHTQEVIRHFTLYCTDPVAFLTAQDNHFVEKMQDKWCCEQEDFKLNLQDFVQAYNQSFGSIVDPSEILSFTSYLEDSWKISWHSKPEIEDLIKSGFLKIEVEP